MTLPTPILAVDSPNFWEVIVLAVNVALVVGQGILHAQAKKASAEAKKMADQAKKIEGLEGQIRVDAKEQMREFLEKETGELRLSIGMLGQQISDHSDRLSQGDGDFKAIEKQAAEQRLGLIREVHQLSTDLRRECATKEDLDRLGEKFDGCIGTLARNEGRLSALEQNRRNTRGS